MDIHVIVKWECNILLHFHSADCQTHSGVHLSLHTIDDLKNEWDSYRKV